MAPAYNHIEIQATYCIAQPKRRPNQRVQPTPLAASEIVAILKDGFVSKLVSIYEAARLTRKTLGGPSKSNSMRYSPKSACDILLLGDLTVTGIFWK